MNRRKFLIRSSGALLITSAPVLPALFSCSSQTTAKDIGLSESQWHTLQAVQNHLFPSEPGAPGAKEIRAAAYLQSVLIEQQSEVIDRKFIKKGIVHIDTLSRKELDKPFAALTEGQREKILRLFENTHEGRHWLSMMLDNILEALLTDPVYGGNPEKIGWHWLKHQPGFPRPPKNKRYYLL